MDTTTQPTPSSSMLRFTLDKQTLEMHMELNALSTSFGAPIDLARVAVSTWEHDLQIVDDTASKSKLYSLPVRLIPAFIDQILGELSTESKAMAIQLRDSFRKCSKRQPTNQPEQQARNPRRHASMDERCPSHVCTVHTLSLRNLNARRPLDRMQPPKGLSNPMRTAKSKFRG